MLLPPRVITLSDLTEEYWKSADFTELSASSQTIYKGSLKALLYSYSREAAVKFKRESLDRAVYEVGSRYSAGRVRQLKAAYRRFAEWALREREVPLPPLSRGKSGRPALRVEKPPKEVIDAVVLLLDTMPWRELTQGRLLQITWGDLQAETAEEGEEGTVILFPGKRAQAWVRIPPNSTEAGALSVLWKYGANGESEPTGPLVPAYPGASVALPLGSLRECVSQARGNPVGGLRSALTEDREVKGDSQPG